MKTENQNNSENPKVGNISKPLLTTVFLSPYLPYGLNTKYRLSDVINVCSEKDEIRNKELNGNTFDFVLRYCKLILKPFDDYSKILDITDEMTGYEIQMIEDNPDMIKRLSYEVLLKMFENHIDVFGLINYGLAISVHDIV
jgi:hypothetical protein